jgi:cobalamin biosynthesis protein CobT
VGKEELMEASSNYDQLLSETAGQTNVLRRTLERKLSAKMKRSWVGGQTNGRLDSRRLVGAYTGSEHVYKVREESDDLDTAVVILVDHSGSMTCRIHTAAKACVALAVALENTPIAYAIQGFTTELLPDKVGRKVLSDHSTRTEYESYCPVVTLRYKEFDERLVRVKGKLGGMQDNFCNRRSLNVDGVSVEKAGRELMMRPEKRKVLMVLSDGEPHDGYSLKEGGCEKHLKHIVNRLANKGVEVFGIGIESEAVKDYYPNYAVLNSVEDLEKEVIGRMDGLLVGGMNVRKAS